MVRTLYRKKRHCSFATKFAANLSYHFGKAHGAKSRNTLNKCCVSEKVHQKQFHHTSVKIGSSSTNCVSEIVENVDNDGELLKEELAGCQHLLDDMCAEHGRQVLNFSLSDLNTKEING